MYTWVGNRLLSTPCLLNQRLADEQKQFEEDHLKGIADVIGIDGDWFNAEVIIAVREKQTA